MLRSVARIIVLLLPLAAWMAPAHAFDAARTFDKGTTVVSVEAGYGDQFDFFNDRITDLRFVNAGVRVGRLPFEPLGPGSLRGSLELGLEPFYQHFLDPVDAFFAGLAAVGRYHFLGAGRLVPYVEVGGAAGGTDLDVHEQNSDFTFLLFGGPGLSYFLTDRTAVYAGYRLQHISNAYTDDPNRGVNSHSAVFGLSVFFGR